MQNLKDKFKNPDGSNDGSLQTCIRTQDLDLIGDGTHLTSFQMLGNFSFSGSPYETSVELWHSIVKDLKINIDFIHLHPLGGHHSLWLSRGYNIIEDTECTWSDGEIGGYCCEMYHNGIEIGNLVNTLGVSTDVGFGFERLVMIVEGVSRVDESSLFDISLPHKVRDLVRTLELFWDNGITPGGKGRNHICRKLLRKFLFENSIDKKFKFDEWVTNERIVRDKSLYYARRHKLKNKNKPDSYWKETFGLFPEEIRMLG